MHIEVQLIIMMICRMSIGERPFECSLCKTAFTTNGNMHRHMRIHDKEQALAMGLDPADSSLNRTPRSKKRCLDGSGDTGSGSKRRITSNLFHGGHHPAAKRIMFDTDAGNALSEVSSTDHLGFDFNSNSGH